MRQYTLVQRIVGLSKMVVWLSIASMGVSGAVWAARMALR